MANNGQIIWPEFQILSVSTSSHCISFQLSVVDSDIGGTLM